MQNLAIVPAFGEPVSEAQQTFRRLLQAMSEPGVIVQPPPVAALGPIYSTTHALCLTLLDRQTPLWLSPGFQEPQLRHNLHFHTGVPLTEQREAAQFALAGGRELGDLDGFARGVAEYPERGCTLILQVEALANEPSARAGDIALRLSGPGIERRRGLSIGGLGPVLVDYLVERPDPFPQGLDLIFTDMRSLAAIPRTTQVEVC